MEKHISARLNVANVFVMQLERHRIDEHVTHGNLDDRTSTSIRHCDEARSEIWLAHGASFEPPAQGLNEDMMNVMFDGW